MSSIITPTSLKTLCEKYKLSPSKQYGQHYLISDAPIRKMIAAANLTKADTVMEIGPGFGVLTLAVAPLVKKVVAFEIEQKLRPFWDEKMQEYPNVEIVWGNALVEIINHKSPKSFASGQTKIINGCTVMANLPYSITSEALRTILEMDNKPKKVVVMVQKEVAERICARPARKASPRVKGEMSLLSLSVQYYGVPRIVAQVPAGCFWPAPKVDSAIVEIINHKFPKSFASGQAKIKNQVDDQIFFKFARVGFAHKRKQLWHNLAYGLNLPGEEVKKVLKEVTGNEKARAEELTVDDWEQIVHVIGNWKFEI